MEIPVSHGIYKVTFEVRSPGLHSYKKDDQNECTFI